MLIALLKQAQRRTGRQDGFTLVELLVVIAILGALAAIVLFNISGVNANAACNAMKTDGATLQAAADLYWNTYAVYPVGTATPPSLPGASDVDTPARPTCCTAPPPTGAAQRRPAGPSSSRTRRRRPRAACTARSRHRVLAARSTRPRFDLRTLRPAFGPAERF